MRDDLWEEEKLERISIHPATETNKAKRPVPGLEGSLFFIFGDAVVFALLFGAFAHDYKSNYAIFSQSQSHLNPEIAITNMLVLLISSGLVMLSLNFARAGRRNAMLWMLRGAIICAAIFSTLKLYEYGSKFKLGIFPSTNEFFSYYFVLTGIHFLHLLVGAGALFLLLRRGNKSPFDEHSIILHETAAMYWHLVDTLWIVITPLIYLTR